MTDAMKQRWHVDEEGNVRNEGGQIVPGQPFSYQYMHDHNFALDNAAFVAMKDEIVDAMKNAQQLIGGISIVSGHIWDCSAGGVLDDLLARIKKG